MAFFKGNGMSNPSDNILQKSEELKTLLANFEREAGGENLRVKVLSLIPVFHKLREIGKSIIPGKLAASARDRIIFYFKNYPMIAIDGNELLVVSGIQEYARRIRELRVQFGWQIINGVTAMEMVKEGELGELSAIKHMGPTDYMLLSGEQDIEAAHRWNVANEIRNSSGSVRDKMLDFFRHNIGKQITGEELRYVAKDRTEWARRVRELRTELGWPIVSKQTGNPELSVGVYQLEADRQSPVHDRMIPDEVRGIVLRRDGYKCTKCGWSHAEWNRSDPRHLELHHVCEHAKGGENVAGNLITVCNICHDAIHRK